VIDATAARLRAAVFISAEEEKKTRDPKVK
jgi:hypothetical protein